MDTEYDDTLEWDADSTEGEDVPFEPLPDFEPSFFTLVPGKAVIDVE